jgi:hypothetical protein
MVYCFNHVHRFWGRVTMKHERNNWPPSSAQLAIIDKKWHLSAELPLPPESTLIEHAFLIACGVRPMALVCAIGNDPGAVYYVALRLDKYAVNAGDNVIAFMVQDDNGVMQCGFAGAPWVIDMLRFAYSTAAADHKHEIIGLLLGYSANAIDRHACFNAGKPVINPIGQV